VPVVTRDIFDKAQEIFNTWYPRMSREEMRERIRFAINKYGMLSQALLTSVPNMPCRHDIVKEFGSLPEAYQTLYPEILEKVGKKVRERIESAANEVFEYEDFLVINQLFTVKIVPTLPFPDGYGHQWCFRVDNRPGVDITLGVPLRDREDTKILGYFPLPKVLPIEPLVCIADTSLVNVGMYGYSELDFILDHIRWSNPNNKESKNDNE
jgi:hypothetical protein